MAGWGHKNKADRKQKDYKVTYQLLGVNETDADKKTGGDLLNNRGVSYVEAASEDAAIDHIRARSDGRAYDIKVEGTR